MTYSRPRLALTEDDNDDNCGDLLRLTALCEVYRSIFQLALSCEIRYEIS